MTRPTYSVWPFLAVMSAITAVHVYLITHTLRSPSPLAGVWFTVFALAIVPIIIHAAFRMLWNPAVSAYPPVPPAADALHKTYQSFSLGIVNMGFSIHASTDEMYLHLTPIAPMRFFGARAASIPWSALKPGKRVKTTAMLDGLVLQGPAWCFERLRS